VLMCC